MHFDITELTYEIIRKAFEYKDMPLDDEEIEEIQLKLSTDKEFAEYVQRCLQFDDIIVSRWKYE